MYYNNKKHNKEFLSDPINTELSWIHDLQDSSTRALLRHMNYNITLAYTYYIYHDYSAQELAIVLKTKEEKIIEWILTAAYVIKGYTVRLTNEGFAERQFISQIYDEFPVIAANSRCRKCVWADIKTGHLLCFRDCEKHKMFTERTR